MNNIISNLIDEQIRIANEVKKEEHTPSGKLSASNFGYPVQWQILRALGVEGKPFDSYTLRKFARGVDVEDWVIKKLTKEKLVLSDQKQVEYRNCIGYLDILCHGDKFGTEQHFPIEVKSVTNAKFRRIEKQNKPDKSHFLQAGYYGVGLDLPYFSVLYVASDDYRMKHFIYDTEIVKDEIDEIIDTFNSYHEAKEIPEFEAIEKWMANPKYSPYPDWQSLDKSTLKKRAKELYK